MATYVYRCPKCDAKTYVERSIMADDKAPVCAVCGVDKVGVYDAPAVSFMGYGWGKDR